MNLKEVNVVGIETLERTVDLVEDSPAGESCFMSLVRTINRNRRKHTTLIDIILGGSDLFWKEEGPIGMLDGVFGEFSDLKSRALHCSRGEAEYNEPYTRIFPNCSKALCQNNDLVPRNLVFLQRLPNDLL